MHRANLLSIPECNKTEVLIINIKLLLLPAITLQIWEGETVPELKPPS